MNYLLQLLQYAPITTMRLLGRVPEHSYLSSCLAHFCEDYMNFLRTASLIESHAAKAQECRSTFSPSGLEDSFESFGSHIVVQLHQEKKLRAHH